MLTVGLLVLAAGLAVGGTLLVGTRARVSGAGLLLAAALTLVAAVPGTPTETLLVAAAGLGAAPALIAYPRLRWRDPVDFAALVAVAGCGVVATLIGERSEAVGVMGMVAAVVYLAHGLWRFERIDETDRLAVLWTLLALGATVLVYGHSVFLLGEPGSAATGLACFTAAPLVMALGVRRPTVVDVRGVITESVVVAVAVLCFVAVFVGVAVLFSLDGRSSRGLGVLAFLGAAVALGLHPLRVALRGVVDELLFGDRPDPLLAATSVADRIGDDPALALQAVREAMVLPYAALHVGGTELAASGEPVAHTRRLPLSLGGDAVGEIVVGLRPGDLGLSVDDENVLRIVAPLLAQTLHSRALADDLQESRGQAIAAIEEERRRLRRDLHDGLGPTLSGIAFTADAARNSLADPAAADALLRGLRSDAGGAIAEIRRLVYDMRPPALDELGLVPALRQRAGLLRAADGSALVVAVEAADLPPLPAAVEVAAYRIVLEALTNAARHSRSDRAAVSLAVDASALRVEVHDGGSGVGGWSTGVGISSMRERAAEVGGSLEAGPTSAGGRVVAVLPLLAAGGAQDPAGEVGGDRDAEGERDQVAEVEAVVVAGEDQQDRPDLGDRGDQPADHPGDDPHAEDPSARVG